MDFRLFKHFHHKKDSNIPIDTDIAWAFQTLRIDQYATNTNFDHIYHNIHSVNRTANLGRGICSSLIRLDQATKASCKTAGGFFVAFGIIELITELLGVFLKPIQWIKNGYSPTHEDIARLIIILIASASLMIFTFGLGSFAVFSIAQGVRAFTSNIRTYLNVRDHERQLALIDKKIECLTKEIHSIGINAADELLKSYIMLIHRRNELKKLINSNFEYAVRINNYIANTVIILGIFLLPTPAIQSGLLIIFIGSAIKYSGRAISLPMRFISTVLEHIKTEKTRSRRLPKPDDYPEDVELQEIKSPKCLEPAETPKAKIN